MLSQESLTKFTIDMLHTLCSIHNLSRFKFITWTLRIVNDIVLVHSRCVSLQDKWLRIYLIGNIVRIFEPHQSDLWLCQTIKSKERMNCISEWIFWHVETKQLFYWFGNQKRLKIKKRFQSRNSLYSEKVCFIFYAMNIVYELKFSCWIIIIQAFIRSYKTYLYLKYRLYS